MNKLIQDMDDSMTVNFYFHANDPSAGLSQHQNINQHKMYVGDTGLFNNDSVEITFALWSRLVKITGHAQTPYSAVRGISACQVETNCAHLAHLDFSTY